jgi:hypothetical protein
MTACAFQILQIRGAFCAFQILRIRGAFWLLGASNPVKTVSEPGVVADFNARSHCSNYLEPAGSSGRELLLDNPVRIGGDNSLVLFAIALIKSALGGLFLAIGTYIFGCKHVQIYSHHRRTLYSTFGSDKKIFPSQTLWIS